MKYFFSIIIMAAFTCLGIQAHAAGADLKTVIDALEQSYNALDDVQADFAQKTYISSVKREERGAGEFFIRKQPGSAAMFRFNYTKPKQQIVCNGKTVWYYIAENNQVMVSDIASMFEGGKGVALNYLTGIGRISKDFAISFSGSGRDSKGNYILDLVPKKGSQAVAKLQFTVDAKAVERFREAGKAEATFPLVSSTVTDTLGNRTTLVFSRVNVNKGISSGRFTFKIPAGAEVIKN